MASSHGLPQPHPLVHIPLDLASLLDLLRDLRTCVDTPGNSVVLPAQLFLLLLAYGIQLASTPNILFEGSELGRSFTQTTNYNCLNSLFLILIFSHVNRSLIATNRSHISSFNINGKV
jgi:hypothetical protein